MVNPTEQMHGRIKFNRVNEVWSKKNILKNHITFQKTILSSNRESTLYIFYNINSFTKTYRKQQWWFVHFILHYVTKYNFSFRLTVSQKSITFNYGDL